MNLRFWEIHYMFHSSLIWNSEQNKKRNHQRKIDMVEQRGTETKSQKSLWRRPSILHYSLSRLSGHFQQHSASCCSLYDWKPSLNYTFLLKYLPVSPLQSGFLPCIHRNCLCPGHQRCLCCLLQHIFPVLILLYLSMSSNKGDYLFLHKTLLCL